MRGACRGEFDAPTTTRECVDGILGEHLERPFDEHGIAVHLMTTAAVRDVDLDARGERRNACLEVACHAVDERVDIHCFPSRLTTDALEPMCHTVEPIEVGAHV